MRDKIQGTQIKSADFDRFVSDVAAAVWNRIVTSPAFHELRPQDYPEIYQTIQRVLRPYKVMTDSVPGGCHVQARQRH